MITKRITILALGILIIVTSAQSQPKSLCSNNEPYLLPSFPSVPAVLAEDSITVGDWKSFPEVKLNIPIASGTFEPTWESIEKNYPGEPSWLRDAKFGIWVHFGPQSAGESG
ncbi:MAG: alpha-L-fucosidase, partial [Paludibacter sp.]